MLTIDDINLLHSQNEGLKRQNEELQIENIGLKRLNKKFENEIKLLKHKNRIERIRNTRILKQLKGLENDNMIIIKNLKVFNCSINESFHWSKLPRLKETMNNKRFQFPSFANLRSADLRFADLSFANLRFANLRSADLRFADLSSANLSSANLSFADLSFANLSFADLRFANLSFADLRSAKLKPINDKEVIVNDFMVVIGLGSQNRQTIIFDTNIGIVLQCGCFYGTEKDFKKQVREVHGGTNYQKEYMEMLKLAKIRFSRGNI